MVIRFAEHRDLDRMNELRRQVNDVHVAGRPDIFRAGFSDELRDHVYTVFRDPMQRILVCEDGGEILGFAVLHRINKPETPYTLQRDFLDVDEFGVDEAHRRQGIAGEMISFIREYAKAEGFDRVELNMWEFNSGALAFYEAAGFSTYRRYMELKL